MTGTRTYELDRAHVFHSWSAQAPLDPMVVTRAEGSRVWDDEGNRYLDFSSQLVFTNIGHQHPQVVAAIQEQAAKLCTIAPQHANDARSEAARLIAEIAPAGLEHGVLHQRRRRGDRARGADGPPAHRAASRCSRATAATTAAPTPRSTLTGDPRRWRQRLRRRPATVHFFGPFLYRSRVRRHHRGGGVRARAARTSTQVVELEGPQHDRGDRAGDDPRHRRDHAAAARATSPACASCATSTASS